MKISKLLLLFLSFLSIVGWAQIKEAASFFSTEKTKVLVVGTFHFDYPNLDVTIG